MARGKKKESALTPEEKLAQALVPVEEQPYKVPENWCWVHLDAVLTEIKNGTTIKQDKSGDGYSVTRIESLQNQTIDFGRLGNIVDASAIKETDWYQEGDIALSHINSAEHVGKTALITSDMLPLVHGMNLLRLRFDEACLPAFYQYYSQSFQYKSEILDRINMAVNQVSINQKQLGSMEFPLPPIKEQQRIVDRIEYLFSKLEEAKEKAQSVLDSFETRKAAILHKAFTGELTAKWREQNATENSHLQNLSVSDYISQEEMPCELPLNWQWIHMGAIGYTNIGLTYKPADKSETGTIVLRSSNIQNGQMDYNDIVRVQMAIPENKMCRQGDILICARNGSKSLVGKTAIVDADGMSFGAFMAIFRSKYNPYIYYFLNSPFFRDLIDKDVGTTTINQVTQAIIKELAFPFAPENEQDEIVRILDILFAKEQQAKEAAEAVLEKIDLLKKSILARAFRGELGTNDPTEESAIELLKNNI